MDSDGAKCSTDNRIHDENTMNKDQALHDHASTGSDGSKPDQCESLGVSESKTENTATNDTVGITSDPSDANASSDESVLHSSSLTALSSQIAPQDITTDTSPVRPSPVRFLIHAKRPEKIHSPWVRERLVSFQLRPGWGSLELTEVMVRMLSEVRCGVVCCGVATRRDYLMHYLNT